MGFALKFQVYVKMKELRIKFRWETEFKETEIGEIPKDWEVKKLGDMATIKTGKTDVKDAVEDGEYPLFDRSDQIKRSNKYLFDTEAVIVPGEGKDFMPRYYKGKFDLHQRTYAIFDFKELNGKYLFFAMHILRHTLRDSAVGSTVESLRLPILKNLDIPYPPLPEQSRIATVLSWFDDLIEVKKRQNEILEKTAMAIFKSWFIDFEPFRDGEFVYSEELDKEIPKGWEVKKLGEVVRIFKGISYKSDEKHQEYIEGAYVFITLDNFMRGGGFKTEYSWIKSERIKPSHLVKESDLIIALTDMTQDAQVVGAPAIITLPKGFEVGVISLDCMKIDPITEHLKYYLYIYLKNTQEENSTFANGVNVLHLIINNFLSGKLVLIPPSHILQSFHSLVEPLFQKIILNQKQIMTLRKIRDTLLPLLVFGKLRVEEV
jgi:type I restriction enzyme S subunit